LYSKSETLKARWAMYGVMIDWMVDLLVETIYAKEDINISEVMFDLAEIETNFKKGKPVFDNSTIPVDVSQARETYFSLVEKTEVNLGKNSDGLRRIMTDSESKTSQLFKESLKEDSKTLRLACENHGVDPHVARLLLRIALRPSLRKMATKVAEEINLTNWSHGYCPVCGSVPAIAKLDGESEGRTLLCSLCETSWAYPRLLCPFCENVNQEDLHYLYSEDEIGLRMDICNCCQGRIKTFDTHYPSGVIIPALDELVTSHLNMATENGRT
jgi:FdhE protein